MHTALKKRLDHLFKPRLDWIQVEVTTHCNSSCLYCPHTIYQDFWLNQHMSLSTFRNLQPFFKTTRLIFLQGWGEPLLHPDFFQMASLAKASGCQVGVSTNGTLLDDEMLGRLVEHQLDVAAFSLAGTESNDRWRRGTTLEKTLSAIFSLHRLKTEKGSVKPAIHIAYLLLRSALDELKELPQLLKESGVTQVVISTLDFIPNPDLAAESIRPRTPSEFDDLCRNLDEIAAACTQLGAEMHYQVPSPHRRRIQCTENVHRSLFMAANGDVAPCVFTHLPVTKATYLADGQEQTYRPIIFGNINQEPFPSVWRKKEYRTFRHAFYTADLPASCGHCPKLWIA